jgi:hypothetical protein
MRILATSARPRLIHPTALLFTGRGWAVLDALQPKTPIPLRDCGDLNIAAASFSE